MVEIIEQQISFFCAHDNIFVSWQNQQTEYVDLLDALFKLYIESFGVGCEVNLPNVHRVKRMGSHDVVVSTYHNPTNLSSMDVVSNCLLNFEWVLVFLQLLFFFDVICVLLDLVLVWGGHEDS